MRNAVIFAAIIASLSLAASPTNASGIVVALTLQSGSQGSGPSGNVSFPIELPRDPAVEAHNRGKSLVSRKIGCKKCAHPGGVKNAVVARNVAEQVRAGEFDLKDNERQLVLQYLTRRFGI